MVTAQQAQQPIVLLVAAEVATDLILRIHRHILLHLTVLEVEM
ncbi:hypothetical protein SDC9_130802 [bioreactor metagenome]|uniref:Uncharacterized protein n=1 Tax=bioreactor metagenome TaxID=1076179 RepID=A0A645D3Q1_9ZZZZ